mgnify:CR=1 FL=1|tara:strand:- start:1319 stop:2197 length:879 start_codon:yes stop_codon:yes gene_type:complete
MQISFLIVTKNRPTDLAITLNKLKRMVNLEHHEVGVFIDGCLDTEQIITDFPWVNWTVSKESVSASPARAQLYKKAKGQILIGLDDDAHPLTHNFITTIENEFKTDASIGILAFQEVRGLFNSDTEALSNLKNTKPYFTSDFVGCGFAISKTAYNAIVGFPTFIDIYGEEPCVALQVLDTGFNIKYVPGIAVNHRVDVEKRKQLGRNYFRFKKQLKNSFRMFLVYYPKPLKPISKLLFHNFKKYALKDLQYFKDFVNVCFSELKHLPITIKNRKPIKKATLIKMRQLKGLKY